MRIAGGHRGHTTISRGTWSRLGEGSMPPTFSPKVATMFDELNAGSRVELDEQAVRVNVSHTRSGGKRDAPLMQEASRGAGLRFRRRHTGRDLTAGATA